MVVMTGVCVDVLLNHDVLNVADEEKVKLGECEKGSCVGELILTILELA